MRLAPRPQDKALETELRNLIASFVLVLVSNTQPYNCCTDSAFMSGQARQDRTRPRKDFSSTMGIILKHSSTLEYWIKSLCNEVEELKDAWGLEPTPFIDRIPQLLEAALDAHEKLKSFWSAARKNGWEQAAINDKQSMEHSVFINSMILTDWMYAVRDTWKVFKDQELHKAWLDYETVSKLEVCARELDGDKVGHATRPRSNASRMKRVKWDDEALD